MLFWMAAAFSILILAIVILSVSVVMDVIKKKQVEGTTPSTSIIIEQIKNEPEPFSWKQYGLGAAIPTFLLLIPIIIFYSIGEYGYADWQKSATLNDDQLVKLSNSEGTEYIGEYIQIDGIEVNYLIYLAFENWNSNCKQNETHNICYSSKSQTFGESLHKSTCLLPRSSSGYCSGGTSWTNEIVGLWNRSNGTIIFDEGQTHGESIIIEFGIQTYPIDPSQPERGEFYAGISGVMFYITPILSLIAISAGFYTGRAGLGYGGVTSLIFVIACMPFYEHIYGIGL
jgi:hypothetical protein